MSLDFKTKFTMKRVICLSLSKCFRVIMGFKLYYLSNSCTNNIGLAKKT